MHNAWALAAFPRHEYSVLGLRLRPLSAGHEILLARLGSPFALGGPVFKENIQTAALICSLNFRDALSVLDSPKRMQVAAGVWGIGLGVSKLMGGPEVDWRVQLTVLNDYFEAGRWAPAVAETSGRGCRSLHAPRAWRMVHYLVAHLGLSEEEGLDFPLARAAIYYATQCDMEGTMDLQGGSDEQSLLEHLAALEKRAADGENVWGN